MPWKPAGATVPRAGAARLATLIERERVAASARGIPVLLLVAGDVLQGTPMSSVYRGEPEFRFLGLLRIDAMALGNHEWDFGAQNLRMLLAQAKFPVVSANVEERGAPFVPPWIRRRAGDIEVAVMGLTTAETPQTTAHDNVTGFTFADPVKTAQSWSDELSDAGLFVIVSHCGESMDRDLARSVPGLDVVVGGHDHTLIDPAVVENGVVIVQAKSYGEYLGRLELEVAGGRARLVANQLIPIPAEVEPDASVMALIEPYAAQITERFKEVIGTAGVFLDGEREHVRSGETNLGNWIADLARSAGHAEVGLVNGGSIRSSINPGPVTLEGILSVYPFENHVVTLSLTGAQLAQLLDRSAAAATTVGGGGFLQASGLSYAIAGGRALDIRVGGMPLDAGRTYRVATTDFTADGGDGYNTLIGLPRQDSGLLLSDLMVRDLRERREISPQKEGRIRRETR